MIYGFSCIILSLPTIFCKYGFMDNYHTEFQNIDYCLIKTKSDCEDLLIRHAEIEQASTTPMTTIFVDPIIQADIILNKLLFGKEEQRVTVQKLIDNENDPMIHYPDGAILRKTLYGNKSAVHLPNMEFMYPGHCRLKVTKDYMQTAVNAFAIFAYGTVEDIYRLPRNYVMVSARTIAMIKVCNEKLTAIWKVFKGDLPTNKITYEMLQLYRPLFQYVSAREMADLNLSDDKIVTFIGTHPKLNRHQVAIIAKRYLDTNSKWATPRYMNLMNNLLCGVPMSYIRSIDDGFFLRISHQVFYHIHACDPVQRRFYLIKMSKATCSAIETSLGTISSMAEVQLSGRNCFLAIRPPIAALGKAYSWSARDVSRLGLLLTEVSGPDLGAINPASMAAISAQVMAKMLPENLRYITESQLKFIQKKSLNILSHKMANFRNSINADATRISVKLVVFVICFSFSFYFSNFNKYL